MSELSVNGYQKLKLRDVDLAKCQQQRANQFEQVPTYSWGMAATPPASLGKKKEDSTTCMAIGCDGPMRVTFSRWTWFVADHSSRDLVEI